jgi:hypothetical protein
MLRKFRLYPCYPRNPWLNSVQDDGGDDFFEARLAAWFVDILFFIRAIRCLPAVALKAKAGYPW